MRTDFVLRPAQLEQVANIARVLNAAPQVVEHLTCIACGKPARAPRPTAELRRRLRSSQLVLETITSEPSMVRLAVRVDASGNGLTSIIVATKTADAA